jgi:hypothetical protein
MEAATKAMKRKSTTAVREWQARLHWLWQRGGGGGIKLFFAFGGEGMPPWMPPSNEGQRQQRWLKTMYGFSGGGMHGGDNEWQINDRRGRGNLGSTRTPLRPPSPQKTINIWQGCKVWALLLMPLGGGGGGGRGGGMQCPYLAPPWYSPPWLVYWYPSQSQLPLICQLLPLWDPWMMGMWWTRRGAVAVPCDERVR